MKSWSRIFSPSGGMVYHYRAFRFSESLWGPHRAHVERFVKSWNPPTDSILLIGPSAGYSLPKDWLAQCRERITLSPGVLPAILPVALVEPYLRALEKVGPNITRERAEISPITRAWRLWLAHARGRL